MIKTKMIFIDGISGSGKSTISHFVNRQMKKNGIKSEWFYELDSGNPFVFKPEKPAKTHEEYKEMYFRDYLNQIAKMVDKLKKSRKVYIVDSFMFQDILNPLLFYDTNRKKIFSFYKKFLRIIKPLDPVLIHFCQNDVLLHIQNNFKNRGDAWKENRIREKERFLFCINRGLKGEVAYIKYFTEMSDISKLIFDTIGFRKLQIENSKKEWDSYRIQILNFLELDYFDEYSYKDSFSEFCGKYMEFNVHLKEGQLYIDNYWPNLKLLYVSDDLFEIEGMPVIIKFERNSGKNVKSIRITHKYLNEKKITYAQNKELKEVSGDVIKKYCSEYLCSSENIKGSVYLENGKLILTLGENDKRPFMYIGKNRFRKKFSPECLIFTSLAGKKSFNYKFSTKEKYYFEEV